MVKNIRASLQHFFNPLHLYCRLRDLGFSEDFARKLCRFYERYLIFKRRHIGL